jgi:4-amino-4-deoxy-L-arabinose transferase-like glycosyltransferase
MSAAPPNDLIRATGWVLFFVALRLVAAAVVPISPDEAYYFDWSRYPSLGYYDHPPMVAWWIAIGTAIAGDGPLGIRLLTVLSAIPTSAAVWATAAALFDRTVAYRAVLWFNVTLLVGVGGFLATPDAPSVMFWALATSAFAEVIRRGDGRWWLLVGLFAGLGVISKLTGLFLGLGLLLALLADRDLRRWLLSPWLWAGALVAELTVDPFLAWNWLHGWVTLGQFARIGGGGFQPLKLPEFIATQFGLLNPLVAIFVGLAALQWHRQRNIAMLLWSATPLVAYLAFHALHQQVQGNWPAPIYPTLAIAAAAAAGIASEQWRGLRSLTFPVGAILVAVGLTLGANPGSVLPPSLDPGLILRGWDKTAADIEAARNANGARWIAGTNYASTAAIAYHLPAVTVVPVTERARYNYAPPPDGALLTEPVLIVGNGDWLQRCFPGAEAAGTVQRTSGAHVLETLTLYRAPGAVAAAFDAGCDRQPSLIP